MNMADMAEYRWILIFIHAAEECDRVYDDVWYSSLEECQQAAEAFDFDFCCGYSFEYERRMKQDG